MTDPREDGDRARPPVHADEAGAELSLVAIGASAGGIAALRSFFSTVPADSGLTFVVVMHLSPDHESHLAEVLQPWVKVPVRQVRERTALEPDRVYVIPPGHSLAVTDGHVELLEFADPRSRRAPIDMFFRTVADLHPDGVGVLLSGSGADGALGLKAIKEQGGLILSQSPEDAEYPAMPRAAADTGLVDFVLPARELGAKVVELRSKRARVWSPGSVADLPTRDAAILDRILTLLRRRSGHDFGGYKKSTVLRRVARRMHLTRSESLEAYLACLTETADERDHLLKDLLISVTRFFRDREAWEALESRVAPAIMDGRGADETVRVWVPGCATGEEAYSIAMLLTERAEAVDVRARIQVFGTDLDADAITIARQGLYPESIAADVSDERLARFFAREGSYYRVVREIRERVVFAGHDILRDPPLSRLDLVSSRNVLLYLDRDLQQRVAQLYRFALRPGGYLFLGSSEGIDWDAADFRAVDARHRIFQRPARDPAGRAPLPDLPLSSPRRHEPFRTHRPPTTRTASGAGLHRGALERLAPPSILVDQNRAVVHASETAGRYLAYPAASPTADLLEVARTELRTELRAVLHRALRADRPARSHWVAMDLDGEPRRVQLIASPADPGGGEAGALVVFLEAALAGSEAESPSDEEFQSITEEYRSALEELETSKEELQSMNEELKTVNDELQVKYEELARSNSDLHNLVAATQIATIFVDRDLRIRRFSPSLAGIFNILPSDEGRPLAHVTHSLAYDELAQDCESVMRTREPVEREVPASDGRSFLARVTAYHTDTEAFGGAVATFTEITGIRRAQEEVLASERRFRVLVETTAQIVWTMDPQGRVDRDSPSWRAFTGQSREDWLDGRWAEVVHPDDLPVVGERWSRALADQETLESEFRLWNGPLQEWRTVWVRAVPLRDAQGVVREWVGMNTDITDRKAAEAALMEAKAAAEKSDEAKSQFLSMLSHELRTPLTAVIGSSELLESGVIDPVTDRHREHLRRIKASAWHLVTIINEILTYTRSEAGKDQVHVSTGDISGIARDVIAMLEPEAEARGLELRLHGADDPVQVTTDRGKVRQIITNLVGNALKFTRQGSVDVELKEAADMVMIEVRDTGAGIPPEHHEEVFEPFFQIDSSSTRTVGGTGLGLAVCRRLARALGGDVLLESTPGEGSSFTLRLPRHTVVDEAQDDGEATAEREA